ncbi:HU family DNA-binding protein [Thermodesulfobacteriota bacterium]
MTKPELLSLISERADITKKAANLALSTIVEVVHSSLQDKGKIRISHLGTFRVLHLKPRKGVNPRTGKAMKIPALTVPRFSPAKSLKRAIGNRK